MDSSMCFLSGSYPGGTGGGNGRRRPISKRDKPNALLACLACRRKKQRCEGGTPCDLCVKLNIACQWLPHAKSTKQPKASRGRVKKNRMSPPPSNIVHNPVHNPNRCKPRDGVPCQFCPTNDDETGDPASTVPSALLDSLLAYIFGTTDPSRNPVPISTMVASTSAVDQPAAHHSSLPAAPFEESYTSPSSHTTLFAGLPFYSSTPAGGSPALSVQHAQGTQFGVDPAVFSQPMVSGDYPGTGPELSDSINIDDIRCDISQRQWLESMLHIGPHTVPDASTSAAPAHQYTPSPVNSGAFPDNTVADDDGFSDPSIYDVMEYARPQQEPEPAYYPFLQETNDWINFDFLDEPWSDVPMW